MKASREFPSSSPLPLLKEGAGGKDGLTIVILTCNQREYTRRCLASLGELPERADVETIIIDNGSNDGTLDMLRDDFPTVKVIANDRNRGVAAARNQGIAAATGRYVLLLDNDTIVTPEAIDALVDYADSHPDVGLCGCRLVDADGNTQDSCKPYPGILNKVRNVLGIKDTHHFPTDPDGAVEPCYIIGACQLIRREAIEQIGPLDEAIFYGPEDADYCLRMTEAGWRVRYLPHITITHLWQRATTRRWLSPLGRKHLAALLYFWRKHRRYLR